MHLLRFYVQLIQDICYLAVGGIVLSRLADIAGFCSFDKFVDCAFVGMCNDVMGRIQLNELVGIPQELD